MKKVVVTFLIISCFFEIALSQSTAAGFEGLLEKTYYNKKRGNLKSAMVHALAGLDQALALESTIYIYRFRQVIGEVYLAKNEYKNALIYYFQIATSAEKGRDFNYQAKGYSSIGDTFSKMKAYEKADFYYTKAYNIFKRFGSKKNQATSLSQLGKNYSISNQFSKSISTFELLNDLAIKENLYSFIASTQQQLFLDNIKIQNHKKAVKYGIAYYNRIKNTDKVNKIADVARLLSLEYTAMGDGKVASRYAIIATTKHMHSAEALEALAITQAQSGQVSQAIKTFDKARSIHNQRNNSYGVANNYNQLAKVAIAQENYRMALSHLQKAEKLGVEKNILSSLAVSYELLLKVYKLRNNVTLASKYESKYESVKIQIVDPLGTNIKISPTKENIALNYEQEAKTIISQQENKRLATEQEKLKGSHKLKDIEILEQQEKLQSQELQQKKLEAERVKQELLIAQQFHNAALQKSEFEKLQLDAELQKLSSEEKAKAVELLEQEKLLLKQQADIQSHKIQSNKQAKLLYYIIIGGSLLILIILIFAFYRTHKNGKTIKEQHQNLAQQQTTILHHNSQLQKNSETMLAINNKLQEANRSLKNTQVHLVQSEKMSSLGLLTAGIAHEINNPINFVSNGVQSLANNVQALDTWVSNYQKVLTLDSIDEIKKYNKILQEDEDFLNELQSSNAELLTDVKYGIVRVTEIVNGLKSFSRHDEAAVQEMNINKSFDSALLILKSKYKNKSEIIMDIDESIPEIQCFPGPLNQVFVNLINNAIDAIEDNGKIKIQTTDLDEHKIQIKISDTGTGMPQEVMDKVFDPFFTTKEVGKGTGLGLSITHGIIQQHKGTICVESELGKGTTFIIELQKKLG